MSQSIVVSPVTFPPGCARDRTSPIPMGSGFTIITIGIVAVASFAAMLSRTPVTTITATLRRTRSVTNSRICSSRPANRGISEHCNSCHIRCDLFKHLQPFPAEPVLKGAEARDVSTGSPQAINDASPDRVGHDPRTRLEYHAWPAAMAPQSRPP